MSFENFLERFDMAVMCLSKTMVIKGVNLIYGCYAALGKFPNVCLGIFFFKVISKFSHNALDEPDEEKERLSRWSWVWVWTTSSCSEGSAGVVQFAAYLSAGL